MTSDRDQLVTAVRDVTVALAAGTKVGTGLFVAPGLVLTCAHVVEEVIDKVAGATSPPRSPDKSRIVHGEWREQHFTLTVVPEWYHPHQPETGGPDLALLLVDGELSHPIACLSGAAAPSDELWAYGYPAGSYRKGDSLTLTFEGPSQRTDGAKLYKARGRAVPGFSGSPALNWRTGMVCGIIRLADNRPDISPLIRLTPMNVALDAYSEALGHRVDRDADQTWLSLLNDDQLRAAGSQYPGPWLRSYLTAACHADEGHPASGGTPDTPGLLEVYQPPQIRNPGGALVEVAKAGIGERDLLVVGDPGSGKSSLLRWVRHQASQRLLVEKQANYVPLLVQARVLAERRLASFPEAIADAVTEELGPLLDHPPPPGTFAREPLPGTPWLLLVDGFEEILTPELRQRAIDAFAYWNGQAHLRLLMTSRPLDNQEFKPLSKKGISPSYLVPFDLERVRRLATAWLAAPSAESETHDAARRAARLVDRIEHGQIKELARIPLVTSMLCILHAADSNGELPQSRYELYDRFVNMQLDRQLTELGALPRLNNIAERYPGGQHAMERLLDSILKLLTAFALRRHRDNQSSGGLAPFAQSWTAELRPPSFPAPRWAAIVMDVLRQSGLIIADDFAHQTLADFLAARAITQDPQDNDVTPEQAAQLHYMSANASFLSFALAGWARHHSGRLRAFCEILSRHPPMQLQFFATLADDGVEIPPDIIERVSAMLATAANNPAKGPETRANSAALLARLDPQRALPRLRLLALDHRTDASFTSILALNENLRDVDVTTILMQADPDSARAVLSVQAADTNRRPERRLTAADRLLELDRVLGIAALRQLVGASSIPEETRLEGLRLIGKADPEQALQLASMLAASANLATEVALAVSTFAPDQALDALARLAVDSSLTPAERIRSALRWAQLSPENQEPRTELASLAVDPSIPPASRMEAAIGLAEVDIMHARPVLEGLARDHSADSSTRARAATHWMRLHPQQAGYTLANLGDINDISPSIAVGLFTELLKTSGHETVHALAVYLQAMGRARSDDRFADAGYFRTLAGLLWRADPARCAREMDEIIHQPGWGEFRTEAEEIWAELEPDRYADHLVEVVHGRCMPRGEAEKAWRFLGGAGEIGGALISLVRLGDPRGAELAEAILQAFHPGSGHSHSEICLYAARAIARLDRERGVNLMTALAFDNRLDGGDRLQCALELIWWDENRATDVLSALIRDHDVLETAGILRSAHSLIPDMTATGQILVERIQDRSIERKEREAAIQELLTRDPDRTLKTVMEVADATADQEESQWAIQRLAKALHALEISLPGYDL